MLPINIGINIKTCIYIGISTNLETQTDISSFDKYDSQWEAWQLTYLIRILGFCDPTEF